MYVIKIELLQRDSEGNLSETGNGSSFSLERLEEKPERDRLPIAMGTLSALCKIANTALYLASLIK